mgnify:CR=1 FL=1|jgi:Molecular chaperone GrpE (heat shock protein)
MAGHNAPEPGGTAPDPARDTTPPAGAEPPRGATPPAGAEPPAAASPPPGAEPGTASRTGAPGGEKPAAGTPGRTERAPGTSAAAQAAEPGAADEPSQVAAELDAKVAELEDRWLRAVADLDNLRKRMARELDRVRAEERARVAGEFLPVLDNLDRAMEHADAEPAAVVEGVRAIRGQAIDVLSRLGYPRQEDEGARFDPARHEAVSTVADPSAEPGTVAKVLRPGYGDGEHRLRPAMVVVATGAARDGDDGVG